MAKDEFITYHLKKLYNSKNELLSKLRSDYVLMPHHGASRIPELLKLVGPSYVIISAGCHYEHPDGRVILDIIGYCEDIRENSTLPHTHGILYVADQDTNSDIMGELESNNHVLNFVPGRTDSNYRLGWTDLHIYTLWTTGTIFASVNQAPRTVEAVTGMMGYIATPMSLPQNFGVSSTRDQHTATAVDLNTSEILEELGRSVDGIHITENTEVDELFNPENMVMTSKEYTVRDIANLIRCNLPTNSSLQHLTLGEDALEKTEQNTPLESIIYNLGTQYILPSYSPQSLIPCLKEFFKSLNEQEANDVVIPYNSGMHWATLRIRVNDNVCIDYIDSLFNEHADINTGRDEQVTRSLIPLNALLKKRFPQKEVKNLEIKLARLQKDLKACGPIVVENIKDIMQGVALPTLLELSDLEVFDLRKLQSTQLESIDKKLDTQI